jgi:hypothetical protein
MTKEERKKNTWQRRAKKRLHRFNRGISRRTGSRMGKLLIHNLDDEEDERNAEP